MTKEELIKELEKIERESNDPESAHVVADELLIEFIDDKEIEEAYNAIDKWYA